MRATGEVYFFKSGVPHIKANKVGEVLEEVVVAYDVLSSAVTEIELGCLGCFVKAYCVVVVKVALLEALGECGVAEERIWIGVDEDRVFGDGRHSRHRGHFHLWERELGADLQAGAQNHNCCSYSFHIVVFFVSFNIAIVLIVG